MLDIQGEINMKKRFLILAMVISMTLCACGASVEETTLTDSVEDSAEKKELDDDNSVDISNSEEISTAEEKYSSDIYSEWISLEVAGEEQISLRLPGDYFVGFGRKNENLKVDGLPWLIDVDEDKDYFSYDGFEVDDPEKAGILINHDSRSIYFTQYGMRRNVDVLISNPEREERTTVEALMEYRKEFNRYITEYTYIDTVHGIKCDYELYYYEGDLGENRMSYNYLAISDNNPYVDLLFTYVDPKIDYNHLDLDEYDESHWTEEEVVDLLQNCF